MAPASGLNWNQTDCLGARISPSVIGIGRKWSSGETASHFGRRTGWLQKVNSVGDVATVTTGEAVHGPGARRIEATMRMFPSETAASSR